MVTQFNRGFINGAGGGPGTPEPQPIDPIGPHFPTYYTQPYYVQPYTQPNYVQPYVQPYMPFYTQLGR
ncbi:hypothetical protein [Bacillus cereus]|nr:hypothetical protein [Bacillus cereus]